MDQIILCQSYDPQKVNMLFKTYFQKFRTAAIAADTIVVVYYKTT